MRWPNWTSTIVAVERKIWSGKATFVFTRTTSGEIGILPSHIPLVAQLVDDAMVRVEREGEDDLRIAVDGGFLSVTEARRDDPGRVRRVRLGDRRGRGQARTPTPTTERTAARGRARLRAARPDSTRARPMSASMMIMVALRRRSAAGRAGAELPAVEAAPGRHRRRSCATFPPSAATAGVTA